MTIGQVLEIITRDQIFYDESNGGVTFSGGEPLAQPGFLVGLLKECGERCVHRTVDTCGYTSQKILSETAIHTDLFLFDIKVMDPGLHLKLTGVDNRLILNNLRWLIDNGKEVIVRVPVIPGINDNRSNTDDLARFLLSLSSAPMVNLLPFHELARGKHDRFGIPFRIETDSIIPPEKIEMIRKRLISHGLTVSGEKEKYESENSST
jgi:pyruvate formate lyase activating enzyme